MSSQEQSSELVATRLPGQRRDTGQLPPSQRTEAKADRFIPLSEPVTPTPHPYRLLRALHVGFKILISPLLMIKFLLDLAISVATFGVLVVLGAWAGGFISDETIAPYLTDIGDRSLSLLRILGLPI